MENHVSAQSERGRRFRALHHERPILVLPNAWDAASARVFELAGARAVGTSSAALAWALGYPDGQHLDRALLVGAVRQIVRAVDVPVTVDFVAGYGDTPGAVCEGVAALIDVGAIGINIEDEMAAPDVLVRKIAAIRDLAGRRDVPLFVNARTDVYLRLANDGTRLANAQRRLRAYEEAGADGLFVPGIAEPDEIAQLVAALDRPINVMAAPGVPVVAELERLGVARVSVGCGPMQATLAFVRRVADQLLREGVYTSFLADAVPYGEVNGWFGPKAG
jgi:2-methylisocitrate lyase-like PEP mutase family enzyme